jgi:hypothetical protein
MKRRSILAMLAGGAAMARLPAIAGPGLPQVEVFKSPHCGCCGAWADHVKAAGFPVKVTLVDDTTAARKRWGMPDAFGSCHTATVGGYVLEGHVPADDVKRLLGAKPVVVGLAVPGMPPGSPGMEVGQRKDPYDVFVIGKGGHAAVFTHYPKA